MASSEISPLLPISISSNADKKATRQVTFSPNPTVVSPGGTASSRDTTGLSPILPQHQLSSSYGSPGLGSINDKLRRRNSAGAPGTTTLPKIGPQRTTKNAEKLKFLPNIDFGEDGPDEESGRDVYSQYTRIKDPTARRDAARLGKADRDRLPRVTAYCTANKYDLKELMKFLNSPRAKHKGARPKLFDECIYTPYNYGRQKSPSKASMHVQSMSVPTYERRYSDGALGIHNETRREDLVDLHTSGGDTSLSNGGNAESNHHSEVAEQMEDLNIATERNLDFDTQVHTPEVFLFDYGVVVIWGMSLGHEERFLKDIAKYESQKLEKDMVETEFFNFYYTREYQARIYNDFITLREKNDYMGKLAISHALAQSVKTTLFEALVDKTIEDCQDIPDQIARTGKVTLSRKEINMQIGELFILRISIHLNGSILDRPELFWAEPRLEPVYSAVRSYLEMDQRVTILTERLAVIKDLLEVLKDQLSHGHGEKLEWIVIVLIAAEILVAAVNIVVDLYAGVD